MSQLSDAMLTTLEQIDSWHEPLLKDLHEHPARSRRRGAWREHRCGEGRCSGGRRHEARGGVPAGAVVPRPPHRPHMRPRAVPSLSCRVPHPVPGIYCGPFSLRDGVNCTGSSPHGSSGADSATSAAGT